MKPEKPTAQLRGIRGIAWCLLMIAVSAMPVSAAQLSAEKHPGLPSSPELHPAPSIQALAVAKDRTVYAGSFGMGIFRSETLGKSWAPVNTGLRDRFILCLAVASDGTVYAGTLHGGVFRTKDGGRNWQAINHGLSRGQVKTLLIAHDAVYAGTGGGVYRLAEGDAGWTIVTKGLDETVVHALVLTDDNTLFAGTAAKGVQRFKAKGSEWSRMSAHGLKDHEGLVENFIRVLVAGKDRTLYAGTLDGGVFRSGDGGETWRPISRALPNDSIRGIVVGPSGLFVDRKSTRLNSSHRL